MSARDFRSTKGGRKYIRHYIPASWLKRKEGSGIEGSGARMDVLPPIGFLAGRKLYVYRVGLRAKATESRGAVISARAKPIRLPFRRVGELSEEEGDGFNLIPSARWTGRRILQGNMGNSGPSAFCLRWVCGQGSATLRGGAVFNQIHRSDDGFGRSRRR